MVAVMVIPAALKAGAEAAVAAVYLDCVGGVFTCPLSANGTELVTHWAAAPIVEDVVLANIQAMAATEPFASTSVLELCEPLSTASTMRTVLQSLNLQQIQAEDA